MRSIELSDVLDPIVGTVTADHDAAWARDTQIEKVDGERWDAFAAGFAEAGQEQTSCHNAARWGAERLEHVIVRRGGELLGGAVVILVKLPGLDRGVALTKWGPLWRRLGQPADPSVLRTILEALKQEYAVTRGYYLTALPHAEPEVGEVMLETLDSLDFRPGWSWNHPDRYLVNVHIDPEELRKSLAQKWRYNLNKSAKKDLHIEVADRKTGLDRFMALYDSMMARKQFFDSSTIGTLPALMQSPVEALRPEVILVHHNGKPVAGAVVDLSGDRAVYLYGATDDAALGLKAGYAMHWWIAEWLCGMPDIRWYDLGGTDGDAGLHQFKKGMVGKSGAILPTPPSYDYSSSFVSAAIGRAIFVLRDARGHVTRLKHRVSSALT